MAYSLVKDFLCSCEVRIRHTAQIANSVHMLSPTYCGFFWPKLSAIWGAFLYMGKYKHKKRAVFVGCHFDVHFTTSTISIMMKIFDYQKMVIYGCQENWGWSLINFSPLRQKLSKTFPNKAINSLSRRIALIYVWDL